MIFERYRAIPSKHTFLMKPAGKLLLEEIVGDLWIDPFCGENSPASIRNDLNPDIKQATHHLDANEFLKLFANESIDGVILDPPYSPRQVSDCYKGFGRKVTSRDTQGSPIAIVRKQVARIVKPGGKVICFGWNSNGIGKAFGFHMTRIMLICHSAITNDTIITVEIKIQGGLGNEVESDIEL